MTLMVLKTKSSHKPLQWRHNERDGVSNTSLAIVYSTVYSGADQRKHYVTGLYEGNSPVIGEFPAQRASTAENVFIRWRHHARSTPYITEVWLLAKPGHQQKWYWLPTIDSYLSSTRTTFNRAIWCLRNDWNANILLISQTNSARQCLSYTNWYTVLEIRAWVSNHIHVTQRNLIIHS